MEPPSMDSALDNEAAGISYVHYEDRLLAFIDILGWAQLVTKSAESAEEMNMVMVGSRLLSFQAQSKAFLSDFFIDHDVAVPPLIDTSHFSDTVVMSCPITSPSVFSFAGSIQLLCQSLLVEGHYTRGAVVVGKLYHRENEIFGPALLQAYDLERNVVKYPRIVVTPKAKVLIDPMISLPDGSKTSFRNILRDFDGLYFVDILGFATGTKNESRRLTGTEGIVLDQIEAKMTKDIGDLGRRAKHGWMVRYIKQIIMDAKAFKPD